MRNIFICSILFISCGMFNRNNSNNADVLRLQESGGFTGAVTTWYLTADGKAFRDSIPSYIGKNAKTISKKTTKILFTKVESEFQKEGCKAFKLGNINRSVQWVHNGDTTFTQWSIDDYCAASWNAVYQDILDQLMTNK